MPAVMQNSGRYKTRVPLGSGQGLHALHGLHEKRVGRSHVVGSVLIAKWAVENRLHALHACAERSNAPSVGASVVVDAWG